MKKLLKGNSIIIPKEAMIEFEKCKKSAYYFATKYLTVNGKPYTTRYTEKDFNMIFNEFNGFRKTQNK